MDSFQTIVETLLKDPAIFTRVRSELQTAENPRARFIELTREYGISIDASELDRMIAAAGHELNDQELQLVSAGVAPGPPEMTLKGQKILINLLLPAGQNARGAL